MSSISAGNEAWDDYQISKVQSRSQLGSWFWSKWRHCYDCEQVAKVLNVEMQGNNIDCVTTTKYLGVIIDELKWTTHILYIKNKISKTIGLFYKMRQYLERKALINLY